MAVTREHIEWLEIMVREARHELENAKAELASAQDRVNRAEREFETWDQALVLAKAKPMAVESCIELVHENRIQAGALGEALLQELQARAITDQRVPRRLPESVRRFHSNSIPALAAAYLARIGPASTEQIHEELERVGKHCSVNSIDSSLNRYASETFVRNEQGFWDISTNENAPFTSGAFNK